MLAILEHPELLRRAVPLSVEAYRCLTEEGHIARNTELLSGVIFEKPGKSPLHQFLLDTITEILRKILPQNHLIRTEAPLSLSDSSPEPDIAIVPGPRYKYRQHHPDTANFIVEIALSSEVLDREKALIYAGAGVEEYWLVLPEKKQIERFSRPTAVGYLDHAVIAAEAVCSSFVLPQLEVRLADWLV